MFNVRTVTLDDVASPGVAHSLGLLESESPSVYGIEF
jgi:hypothetical protein